MRAWRIMDFRCSAARRSRSSAVRIRPPRTEHQPQDSGTFPHALLSPLSRAPRHIRPVRHRHRTIPGRPLSDRHPFQKDTQTTCRTSSGPASDAALFPGTAYPAPALPSGYPPNAPAPRVPSPRTRKKEERRAFLLRRSGLRRAAYSNAAQALTVCSAMRVRPASVSFSF